MIPVVMAHGTHDDEEEDNDDPLAKRYIHKLSCIDGIVVLDGTTNCTSSI